MLLRKSSVFPDWENSNRIIPYTSHWFCKVHLWWVCLVLLSDGFTYFWIWFILFVSFAGRSEGCLKFLLLVIPPLCLWLKSVIVTVDGVFDGAIFIASQIAPWHTVYFSSMLTFASGMKFMKIYYICRFKGNEGVTLRTQRYCDIILGTKLGVP